jgi:phage shock protein PspC (stress-responsive transcriptional regulator)
MFITQIPAKPMPRLQAYMEKQLFGVCTALGEVTGVSSGSIRLFFIYLSFLTFGSPVFIYLALAFIINMPKHWRRKQSSIWDF